MKRIIYVGIDVHLENYALCCLEPSLHEEDKIFGQMKVRASVTNIVHYLNEIAKRYKNHFIPVAFICGYEAGFAGYSLYHEMIAAGIKCIILAPSTMAGNPKQKIKTDKRDAERIAKCLAYGTYQSVHVPTREDEEVRAYIRMRDDHMLAFKKIKQQINAFCLRLGNHYSGGRSKWTHAHLHWLLNLELSELNREILDEYLVSYHHAANRLEGFTKRIEELAARDRYRDQVKRLSCFIGMKTYTCLSLIVETSDFQRFAKAEHFASYLGLTPGEISSGDTIRRTGITKAGNKQMRSLLVEAAHSIGRGQIGYISKALAARQQDNPPKVIAYANRANERLRRKFYRMIRRGRKYNVVITAIARELACFVWGMMTNNIDVRQA